MDNGYALKKIKGIVVSWVREGHISYLESFLISFLIEV